MAEKMVLLILLRFQMKKKHFIHQNFSTMPIYCPPNKPFTNDDLTIVIIFESFTIFKRNNKRKHFIGSSDTKYCAPLPGKKKLVAT